MISAGIVGASGYMGGEALRVLLDHPEVEIAWATSRRDASVEDFHPNLFGTSIKLVHPDSVGPADVVFLALPTKASIEHTPDFLEQGAKVIDLGSAFRLNDQQLWESVYGMKHAQWPLADEAVYGINELHLDAIKEARLVANPGCFSSAAILGLAPVLAENMIARDHILVDGLSGTAGAGAGLDRSIHHPEIGNNIVAYNVVGHRHTFEMEQELGQIAGEKVTIHFTPLYVPITRGILDVCHVFPNQTVNREQLLDLYRDYYSGHPFVKIYDVPREEGASWQYKPYPWVSAIAGTNYCHIGIDVDPVRNRVVIFSALDSVGKGGAQVGIENMNLMFDLPRTAGLARPGLHPN